MTRVRSSHRDCSRMERSAIRVGGQLTQATDWRTALPDPRFAPSGDRFTCLIVSHDLPKCCGLNQRERAVKLPSGRYVDRSDSLPASTPGHRFGPHQAHDLRGTPREYGAKVTPMIVDAFIACRSKLNSPFHATKGRPTVTMRPRIEQASRLWLATPARHQVRRSGRRPCRRSAAFTASAT